MNHALPMVYLVRHAETAWTLTAQHTGLTDLPLPEQGEGQARAIGPTLAALRVDRMLSSPLQRARRTAELAMPHARVEVDDELREWDYGAFEGRRTTEIDVGTTTTSPSPSSTPGMAASRPLRVPSD